MIRFHQTPDGGEIAALPAGSDPFEAQLETLAYLCLFGGNEDDPGGAETRLSWFGNLLESDPARQYRSETQYLLRGGLPATSGNLRRLSDAVHRDLAPALRAVDGRVSDVQVRLLRRNRVSIRVALEVRGSAVVVDLEDNWQT